MTQSHTTTIETTTFTESKNQRTGATFQKWNVKDSEGNWYSQIVREDFEPPVNAGDEAEIKFNQNGNFKNIVEVVNLGTGEVETNTKTTTKATTALKQTASKVAAKTTTKQSETTPTKTSYTDNSKGMRNGMITNKAVDLAIARNQTDLEDIQQAALDVMQVASFVEEQNK